MTVIGYADPEAFEQYLAATGAQRPDEPVLFHGETTPRVFRDGRWVLPDPSVGDDD